MSRTILKKQGLLKHFNKFLIEKQLNLIACVFAALIRMHLVNKSIKLESF